MDGYFAEYFENIHWKFIDIPGCDDGTDKSLLGPSFLSDSATDKNSIPDSSGQFSQTFATFSKIHSGGDENFCCLPVWLYSISLWKLLDYCRSRRPIPEISFRDSVGQLYSVGETFLEATLGLAFVRLRLFFFVSYVQVVFWWLQLYFSWCAVVWCSWTPVGIINEWHPRYKNWHLTTKAIVWYL